MNNNINNILNKYNINNYIFNLIIQGKPVQYLRPRKGGNHFYNPRGNLMAKTRQEIIENLDKDMYSQLQTFVSDPDKTYYVFLEIKYFIPIPKAMKKDLRELAEAGILRVDKRPDIDNYDKHILDTLHDVFYDDDKRVVSMHCEKFYSDNPRTEIKATIQEITKK